MFLLFRMTLRPVPPVFQSFTFQYVSIISGRNYIQNMLSIEIYIPICFYYFWDDRSLQHGGLNQFTFQYVSIISISSDTQSGSGRNLHSNMFLLFRTNQLSLSSVLLAFTFQYVSIISERIWSNERIT